MLNKNQYRLLEYRCSNIGKHLILKSREELLALADLALMTDDKDYLHKIWGVLNFEKGSIKL